MLLCAGAELRKAAQIQENLTDAAANAIDVSHFESLLQPLMSRMKAALDRAGRSQSSSKGTKQHMTAGPESAAAVGVGGLSGTECRALADARLMYQACCLFFLFFFCFLFFRTQLHLSVCNGPMFANGHRS